MENRRGKIRKLKDQARKPKIQLNKRENTINGKEEIIKVNFTRLEKKMRPQVERAHQVQSTENEEKELHQGHVIIKF